MLGPLGVRYVTSVGTMGQGSGKQRQGNKRSIKVPITEALQKIGEGHASHEAEGVVECSAYGVQAAVDLAPKKDEQCRSGACGNGGRKCQSLRQRRVVERDHIGGA